MSVFKLVYTKKMLTFTSNTKFFSGAESIFKQRDNMVQYRVSSTKDITKLIISHFDIYPLLTQKQAYFLLFKQAKGGGTPCCKRAL